MTQTFRRARSPEQREQRRRTILATAESMLAEMPVAALTLTELARRTGLAKSNVLRYFSSREAVLLEVLDRAWKDWIAELTTRLRTINLRRRVDRRAAAVAGELTASVAGRPMLCDLLAAQSAVLEQNVSAEVAATFKHAALANTRQIAAAVADRMPELTGPDAVHFTAAAVMSVGAIWSASCVSPGMAEAYRVDPELARYRLDFSAALAELLDILLLGLLARHLPWPAPHPTLAGSGADVGTARDGPGSRRTAPSGLRQSRT